MFDMFNQPDENQQDSYESGSNAVSGDTFVVSIGGSLIFRAKPDTEKLRLLGEAISSLHGAGKKIVLVVGGGKIARDYVEALRLFEAGNFEQDLMGITITRANALLVAGSIPEAHGEVLTEITKVKDVLGRGMIPVFGGIIPFFTTDSVGALLAEHLKANFVNLTNVDGIYNEDPNDYPDAKRYDEISYDSLISLISSSGSKPGRNVVLDIACCMILKRSSIPAVVLDGNDIENFKNYVNGYSYNGTTIKEDAAEPLGNEEIEDAMEKPKRKTAKKKRKVKAYREDKEFSEDDIDSLKL